ncbi:SigE family RNA polymerase sigma factor [Nocardioides marmorisolisilvae]|uniref:SigE family RNA polymerase sigma factor n=1 Tax=Nocardioides marmorisolisilvae TaxID=1542737 RepID=A0A3N0E0N4_9ACTN|nr:SigE family RNA polymerase sigma factor [Nocardioides marmorisolisilvae]RNL81417.1 SigE family RNA polymerase sigma factor [Nocardioides marmorisolisilvae]
MGLRSTTLADTATPAYEDYVAARWTTLYRTAYLLTGSHADAEDLAQTTLVKAYQSWIKVAAAASPDAYVRRIMTNTFVSSKRPLRVSRERLVDVVPEAQAADAVDDLRLQLWPHITSLPPKQRAVIVLRYYEDLSEAQIAEALGCSPGTVKSNASLALSSLRARMAAEEGASS